MGVRQSTPEHYGVRAFQYSGLLLGCGELVMRNSLSIVVGVLRGMKRRDAGTRHVRLT